MPVHRKWWLFGLLSLVLLVLGTWLLWPAAVPEIVEELEPEPEPVLPYTTEVIGESVEARNITVYTFGNGEHHLLLVGGMHGGYEWNSVVLAYQMIEYFTAKPELVPSDLTVSIIPSLNPDGVYAVLGTEDRFTAAEAVANESDAIGRFNANDVDLNRNFDCKWQPESRWRGQTVSAGTSAFSEPEAAALRDYVLRTKPEAVVFWHSQANAVYASECEEGVLPSTLALMNTYADAAEYKAIASFDAYPVSGDAEGWLASIGIPAITVELATHETVEWERNLAGVNAVLMNFSAIGL